MTDLSGIELRKELLIALGWTFKPGEGMYAGSVGSYVTAVLPNGEWHRSHTLDSLLDVFAPKYESDATLFFALLDKVCKERGWAWEMWRPANDLCHCAILTERRLLIASEEHKDVPTAGARCLLSALKADTR